MTEPAAKRRLGDIVVDRKLVTPAELEYALSVQRQNGGKLGEILVELGFITRVALAGVITEQWDELRLTSRARKATVTVAPEAVAEAGSGSSAAEVALRERVDALTAELAARDQRIAQLDATVAALLAQLGQTAA
jgi:hypothetical protein